MRVADFSANVGGFLEGFRQAGHQVVFSSEQDEVAREVLAANFPSAECLPSLSVQPGRVPHADVVCASAMGGGVLDKVAGMLSFVKPRAIVFEYDSEGVAMIESTRLAGYQTYFSGRGRGVVMVALRDDVPTPFLSFPFPPRRQPVMASEVLDQSPEDCLFLTEEDMKKAHADVMKANGRGVRFRPNIVSPDGPVPRIPISYHKNPNALMVKCGNRLRRLSIGECKRMAGFPDSYQVPISRTQAYRLMARATDPAMASDIASELETWLG